MKFEDVHPAYVPTGEQYIVTNEEPDIHRLLLRSRTIKRAVAIAGGGEVSLFVLLPRVRKELVVVDHSYAALAAFYTKAFLLEQMGPKALRDLIINKPLAEWVKATDSVLPQLPEPLGKYVGEASSKTDYTHANKLRGTNTHVNLRKEWFYADEKALSLAVKKLHKLTLIHGDLTDIKDKGPFDFLYLSNAAEHFGRSMKKLTQAELDPMLAPNSLVLTANKPYGAQWKWKELSNFNGIRGHWHYYLFMKES